VIFFVDGDGKGIVGVKVVGVKTGGVEKVGIKEEHGIKEVVETIDGSDCSIIGNIIPESKVTSSVSVLNT
jgi:hypothetical protein